MSKKRTGHHVPGGFVMLPNWVRKHPDLGRVDIMVYIALAGYADNDNRTCWPSYPTIMGDAKINDNTSLRNSLRRLELCGCIEIDRRKGFANLYHLPIEPPEFYPQTITELQSDKGKDKRK